MADFVIAQALAIALSTDELDDAEHERGSGNVNNSGGTGSIVSLRNPIRGSSETAAGGSRNLSRVAPRVTRERAATKSIGLAPVAPSVNYSGCDPSRPGPGSSVLERAAA
jgi:hypothetical protein